MFGKNFFKSAFFALFTAFFLPCFVAAQSYTSEVASGAFVQGAKAFSAGEWISSIFLLRKAVSYPENNNAETWYMLITAEMYAGEYKNAYQDCEYYFNNFPGSPYVSYVMYQSGRALFCMGEYERSVLTLSDFCHQYPDHEMYASALYWIAESFFTGYNYDDAKILYQTVVNDYPNDAKASAAQHRIETIAQSAREEKLLYLLKETGEEYLAAKEEYERQLRTIGAENSGDVRRRVLDLQKKISELENKVSDLTKVNSDLKNQLDEEIAKNSDIKQKNKELVSDLKRRVSVVQQLLDEKKNNIESGDAK